MDAEDRDLVGQAAVLLLAVVVSVVVLAAGAGLAAKVFSILSGFP